MFQFNRYPISEDWFGKMKTVVKKKIAVVSGKNFAVQSSRAGTKPKATPVKEFHVEWVDIDSIKLWEDNPRWNDDASTKLAKIIENHGIKSPIICWDKNRVIYKGNTTYKACKLLGYKKVPVVFHSFASETSAKAYGIADNKASEMASWDEELLHNMMSTKEFKTAGFETGFSDKEIELMDFWPPEEHRVAKAKKEGKQLCFNVRIQIPMDDYETVLKEIKKTVKPFKGVVIK